MIEQFPHCDQRILHPPSTCDYCDGHPEWQELRRAWGIAFTGVDPVGAELPCPADHARPPDTEGDHRRWHGNRATGADPATLPAETPASRVVYPDAARPARRRRWPWGT